MVALVPSSLSLSFKGGWHYRKAVGLALWVGDQSGVQKEAPEMYNGKSLV